MAKKSKTKNAKNLDNEINKLDKLVDFDNEAVDKQANAVEEPVVEEPVVEQPVVEEPIVEQPARYVPSPGYEYDEEFDVEIGIEPPQEPERDDFVANYRDINGKSITEKDYYKLAPEYRGEGPIQVNLVEKDPRGFEVMESSSFEPKKNNFEFEVMKHSDFEPTENDFEVMDDVDFMTDEQKAEIEKEFGIERSLADEFEVMHDFDFEPAENKFDFEVMEHENFEPKKNNFDFEVMNKSQFPSAEEVSPNANKEREPESKILHNVTDEDIQKLRAQGYEVREASYIERFVDSIKQFIKAYTDNIKAFANFISGAYTSDKKKEASPESEKNNNSKDEFEVMNKKDFEPIENNFEFEVVDKKDFEVNGKFAPNDGGGKPNIDEPQISQPNKAQVGEQQVKIEPAMVKKTHVEAKEDLSKEEKKDLSQTKAVNIELKGANPKERETEQPNLSVQQQLAAASSKEEVRNIAAKTIVNVMESQSKEPFTQADRSQLIKDTLESPVFETLTNGKSKEELSDYVASTNIVNDFANETITHTKNVLITKAATIIANEKFNGNILPEEAKKMAVTKVKTVSKAFRSLTQGKSIEDLNKLVNGGQLISEYEKAAANPDLQTKQIRSIDGTVKYQGQPREVSTKRSNAPGL